jgi:hypothetical protein
MIVVMGILLILATMLVAMIASPILVQDKAKRGAGQVQLWFRIAKSRAVADNAPRGLRLIADSDGLVRQLQYIEQPTDFIATQFGTSQPNPITISVNASGQATASLAFPTNDFTGGLGGLPQDDPNWPVQPDRPVPQNNPTSIQSGDYLELQGGGLLHRITHVFPSQLQLASAPVNVTNGSQSALIYEWRIIRGPRVLKGETPLQLPQDTVIDIANCFPAPTPTGTSDILFAPSGRLLGALGAQDRVVLWVCDATQDSTSVTSPFMRNGQTYNTGRVYYQNNPMLVSIHARTGFIAVQPVDVSNSPSSDFSFTLDGRLSGF